MNLSDVVVPTRVVHAGTTFEEALKECVEKRVPGIPYVNESRQHCRSFFVASCIPHGMCVKQRFAGWATAGRRSGLFRKISWDCGWGHARTGFGLCPGG